MDLKPVTNLKYSIENGRLGSFTQMGRTSFQKGIGIGGR